MIRKMVRIGGYLALLMFLCQIPALADVAQVDDGNSATGFLANVTELDATVTIAAGTDLCLVAFLHTNAAVSATSVVWDAAGANQTMTARGDNSGGGRTEVFVLPNPTPGVAKTLHSAWTTGSDAILGWIILSGADQTTCIDTGNTAENQGTGTAASLAVTATADGATIAAMTTSVNISTTDTLTAMYLDNSNSAASAASYTLSNAANSHQWTVTSSVDWNAIGVNVIVPAAGGATRQPCCLLGVF